MMLASASGVSTTRDAPYFSIRPLVVRKTPPSRPTSRPRSMTRGSRSISSVSALLMASTTLRSGIAIAPPELLALLEHARRRTLVDVVEHAVRADPRLCGGGFDDAVDLGAHLGAQVVLALLIEQAQRAQVAHHAVDGVAPLEVGALLLVLIAAGVVGGVVEAHPVGHRLDQGGPIARARPAHGLDRSLVDREDVVAVHLHAREAVAGRPQREARRRRLQAARRRDRPLVVLHEEDDGDLLHAGQVEGLVEVALGGAAVADVGPHDRVLALQLETPGQAHGLGQLGGQRDLGGQHVDALGDARGLGGRAHVRGGALLERVPVPATLASAGNAGLSAPGHSFAWASPSAPKELWRSLTVGDTALRVNPIKAPGMFFWGLRFLRECNADRATRNTLVKLRLARYSQAQLDALTSAEHIDYHGAHQGCLYVDRDRARVEGGGQEQKLGTHQGLQP